MLWLPIAGVLTLAVPARAAIRARPQIATFAVAIWGAYLIRSLLLWMLGMVTFWTTRVGAIFEAYFAAELLLSGRLVPVSLMPELGADGGVVPAVRVVLRVPDHGARRADHERRTRRGLIRQVVWIGIGAIGVALMWRRAVCGTRR